MDPKHVHETLKRHQLADGFSMVLDLERSHGSWLYDARENVEYLDFFTCFASWPLGYNHAGLREPRFLAALTQAALNNPSNSDLYTSHMAEFVETFATKVTPKGFPYHFWISGGALAVENAIKVAFDWKAHKIGLDKLGDDGASLSVLHFRQAFHGRSGYTMSLTNTDPKKVALFPKFDWPRISNPAVEYDLDGRVANDVAALEAQACAEIEAAFKRSKNRIAAILIEPMQGEGGDNHFRTEFLQRLRKFADDNEALLVFDEVQTGFFGSGKPWMWQHHDVRPDVVAFGKKTQVCGIYAGPRVDEVPENVFHVASRINSTWGGSLTDMVRCRRFIELILENDYCANTAKQGARFIAGLRATAKSRGVISNVRGTGSLVAFTLDTPDARAKLLNDMRSKQLLALNSGERSIRFRMPLVVTEAEIDTALERISACLPSAARAQSVRL
ncbi:MAG: L-lysine 6-transaminase [Planctomycetota bacterium]|nr:L-lysine 6-transaminase [Planctomycetota bacterium]